jgi:4-carboxymuconolactone decarboxylase
MNRHHKLIPSELDPIQRELYINITSGRRTIGETQFRIIDNDGRLEGPFNFFVSHPGLGSILSKLGEFIRYDSILPPRLRELLILCIAADFQSEFEWYAHVKLAINEGVSNPMIESILAGIKPADLDSRECTSYDLYQKLKMREVISDEFFSKLTEQLDAKMILEIISLVGYYATLAMMMNTFSISLPEGEDLTFAR